MNVLASTSGSMSEDHHHALAEKTTDLQVSKPMNSDKVCPSEDALLAELATSAPLTGAVVAVEFSKRSVGELNLAESVSVLKAKVAAVHRGDLREAEAILTAQALALNAIFTELAVYSRLSMQHSLDVADRLMRLALKAQGQCRVTFETLVAIKNPPAAAFARQANIAHGPQQVNNAIPAPAATKRAPASPPELEQNELLEHQDGERLDAGTAGAAGASGAAMATVGALDRPPHR
jgi:hypothetical protein